MGKPKESPPDPDDPRYLRTCNLCGVVRRWIVPVCECGGVEFSLPATVEPAPDSRGGGVTVIVRLFLLKWLVGDAVKRAAIVAARDEDEVKALGYVGYDVAVPMGTAYSGGMRRQCVLDATDPTVYDWGMRDIADLQAEADEENRASAERQREYDRTHPPRYPRDHYGPV